MKLFPTTFSAGFNLRYFLKIGIGCLILLVITTTVIFANMDIELKAIELSEEQFQRVYDAETDELTDKKSLEFEGLTLYYFISEKLTLYYYIDVKEDTPAPDPETPVTITDSIKPDTLATPIGPQYYVSPVGNDTNSGTSATQPWRSIQKALDTVGPGATINLAVGTYVEDLVSRRNGTKTAPITLKGSPAAVLKGNGAPRLLEINHDYINLVGFTIDGLRDGNSKSGYTDKLIYVQGKEANAGVTGLKIKNMTIKNAGGECIRLRYFATKNEIAGNTILNCGVFDFRFDGGGKNGEGVYIGTAPEQTGDGKNPTSGADQSNGNWIHHNKFNTQGNECVDIKEGSSANIVEHNICTGQKDSDSAGLDSRGSNNIFRYNQVFNNLGAGVRLGGDSTTDGTSNDVYGNTLADNRAGGIKFQANPQNRICGNIFTNNDPTSGKFASYFSPNKAC